MGSTIKSNAQDHARDDVLGLQKRTDSSVETELSPTVRSEPPPEGPSFLLTPDTTHESIPIHSPIKRRRTTANSNSNSNSTSTSTGGYQIASDRLPHATYDPIRSQYRIYDSHKVFTSVSPDGVTYMPDQSHVPKVVEAEYRRLADSAAAAIPPASLLSPAIWKEEFYWPNQFTTTQCACLMRYYIENLAPWVGQHLSSDHMAKTDKR